MNLSLSNDALGRCGAAADVDNQAHDQIGQIEAAVESVGEGAEVAVGVLGVSEGLVRALEHRLEVTQHRVDPFELRQLPRLALAHEFDGVSAPGIGHRCKARKAIAEHAGACGQVAPSPRG